MGQMDQKSVGGTESPLQEEILSKQAEARRKMHGLQIAMQKVHGSPLRKAADEKAASMQPEICDRDPWLESDCLTVQNANLQRRGGLPRPHRLNPSEPFENFGPERLRDRRRQQLL